MAEDTPNWDIIGHSLRSLFSKYDIDLSNIGLTQRLGSEDFETIFYHLFIIIDPSECRRRFWSIYPTRNQEEKSRFIENTMQFINGKQLSSYKISAYQLRMCGGEPFRRLLSSLIKKAADLEFMAVAKKVDCPLKTDLNWEECLDSLDQTRAIMRDRLLDLKNLVHEFNRLQETLAEKKREIGDTWEMLTSDILRDVSSYEYSSLRTKEIYKLLVAKLEKSNARCSVAAKTIKEIPIPIEASFDADAPVSKLDTSKRMSHIFKEMRELTLSPEYSPMIHKSRVVYKISQKFMNYDNGVEALVSIWEDELEKADEALLEIAEMRERYKYFEKLIPFIKLRPIGTKDPIIDGPKLSELREILSDYPDPRYDDNEIMEVSKEHFKE